MARLNTAGGNRLVVALAALSISGASTASILVYLAFATGHLTSEIIGLLSVGSLGSTGCMALLARAFGKRELALRKERDDFREASRRDLLTGMLNHGAVVEEVHQLPSLAGPHALLMTDVDGLKRVNDLYGHAVGDQMLGAVAGCLAQPGAVVGRYGGDEFLSILKNSNRCEAEEYRERVMAALRDARVSDPATGDPVLVQASLGIAIFPDEADKIEEALALSDEAMYAMKRQRPLGRDTNRQKYELNVERLAGILGAFAPLLSGDEDLADKMDGLAHRLRVGTGTEAIIVTLWPHKGAPPVVRTALASPNRAMELQHNSFFEALDYDRQPVWQQLRRTCRPVVINDFETDERFSEEDRGPARAAGMRSALVVPLIGPDGIVGAVYVASRQEAAFGPADIQFFSAVADLLVAVATTSFLLEEVAQAAARRAEEHEATVMRLAAAAEAHAATVGPHLSRVRQLSELLAQELGLSPANARDVGLAAALHDVGKLYIPESLLASTLVLSGEEKREFEKHTYLGEQFLAGPGMELAAVVARCHHERWDGGGYPDGLRAEEIPEPARITAVADALDSMTHDRSYQSRRSLSTAMEEIAALSGRQFCPHVVQALRSLYERGVLTGLLSGESASEKKAA